MLKGENYLTSFLLLLYMLGWAPLTSDKLTVSYKATQYLNLQFEYDFFWSMREYVNLIYLFKIVRAANWVAMYSKKKAALCNSVPRGQNPKWRDTFFQCKLRHYILKFFKYYKRISLESTHFMSASSDWSQEGKCGFETDRRFRIMPQADSASEAIKKLPT